MNRYKQANIPSQFFLNIIELSKKMKAQIITCCSVNGIFFMYGLDKTVSVMKKIQDFSNKPLGELPIGFSIESKYLSEIEKTIKETNIEYISIMSLCSEEITNGSNPFYNFSKFIVCADLQVPLLEFSRYITTCLRIESVLAGTVSQYGYIELTNNEEFISILETKADNGVSPLHIGNHLVFISPGMLNVLKDDIVSVSINNTSLGSFAIFNIERKKKKCSVQIVFRVMDITKQP